MLPNTHIRSVSRADVDRIGGWLGDDQISSSWFGHYGCGEPIHRGYDPNYMLESGDAEWHQVFDNPNRMIFSLYNDEGDHIGESQIVLDHNSGAELALLIGRKDLWHHGYGSAASLVLMDQIFTTLDLDRAWVNIPEDNQAALGLFEKLGFTRSGKRELCTRPDGSILNAYILTIDKTIYENRHPSQKSQHKPYPIVTITGPSGSLSKEIASQTSRLLGSRLIDSYWIREELCQRLKYTNSEIERFQNSFGSRWGRLLSNFILPVDWTGHSDNTFDSELLDFDSSAKPFKRELTKLRYREALNGLMHKQFREGNVVIHGNGSHNFTVAGINQINVFISRSLENRTAQVAVDSNLSQAEASKLIEESEKKITATDTHLWGRDFRTTSTFDLIINLDRNNAEEAAQMIAATVLKTSSEIIKPSKPKLGIPTS